jgi:ferredoxin-NADP reductase
MQVEITNIIDESFRVKRFELSTLDGSVIEFLPGQFIQIIHPSLPEFNNTRSYSISSENTNSNKILLY